MNFEAQQSQEEKLSKESNPVSDSMYSIKKTEINKDKEFEKPKLSIESIETVKDSGLKTLLWQAVDAAYKIKYGKETVGLVADSLARKLYELYKPEFSLEQQIFDAWRFAQDLEDPSGRDDKSAKESLKYLINEILEFENDYNN